MDRGAEVHGMTMPGPDCEEHSFPRAQSGAERAFSSNSLARRRVGACF